MDEQLSAVRSIAWLGLLGFFVTRYQLLRPARCADQANESGSKRQTRPNKIIKAMDTRVTRRSVGRNGEIMNPVDDICDRRQNEKEPKKNEGETVEVEPRKAADVHGGIKAAAHKPRHCGRENPKKDAENEEEQPRRRTHQGSREGRLLQRRSSERGANKGNGGEQQIDRDQASNNNNDAT